jgi:hypothetical protein
VTLAAGLAACMGKVDTAASLPEPAAPDQQVALQYAYVSCLSAAAGRLDDGKENPIKLTLRIEPFCSTEFDNYAAALSRGYVPFSRHNRRDDLVTGRERFITSIVLQQRRIKRFGE